MGYRPKKRGSFPKPKRQNPAAPPVRRDPQVKAAFQALQGTPAPGYWEGMTEQQWSRAAAEADDHVYRKGEKPRWNFTGQEYDLTPQGMRKNTEILRQFFPQFPQEEVVNFSQYAHNEGRRPQPSKHHDLGVPHAAASESLIQTAYEQSGVEVEKLNTGNVEDTDLFLPKRGQYVDVQDMMINPGEKGISIGVLHNLSYDTGKNAWNQAADGDTLEDIVRRIVDENGGDMYKLSDKLMHDGKGSPFKKDLLVGSVRNKNVIRNEMGPLYAKKGSFNRSVGSSEFALDLNRLRPDLMKSTKGQLEAMRAKQNGSVFINDSKKLKFYFDLKKLQKETGQQGLITTQFSDDVLRSIDDVGKSTPLFPGASKNIRDRYTTSFHSGLPIDDKDLRKGARKLAESWRGGLTNTLLNGASREAGVKLGKSDYAGAAIEFGVEYGKGALVEQGVKQVGKTGLWQGAKRIAGAVGKRLPASLARFKTGTAATGGLAAPLLGIATVVDVADGITEGVTGKGIYNRGLEAGERAEAKKRAAVAAGASKTDLRRAARRSQPIAVPKPVTEPVAVQPPAPTPVKAKQIVGAWKRRRGKK